MKRILLTLTLLFIGLTSFSQLDLSWTQTWVNKDQLRFHTEPDTLIQRILDRHGDTVKIQEIITHKFDDGYIANVIIFTDHDGYFIDVVYIVNSSYNGYIGRHQIEYNGRDIIDHKTKRKISHPIKYSNDIHELMFDDGSKIKIKFDEFNRMENGSRVYNRIVIVDSLIGKISNYIEYFK